jgi:hypothetical protein
MPKYNPMDMAYVLKMSKTGSAMTPRELELMQNINQAMLPEVAAGNVGILPPTQNGMPMGQAFPQAGAAMSQAEMARMMQGQTGAAMTPVELQRMMNMRGR